MKTKIVENPLLIESLMGTNSRVDRICKECIITLVDRALKVDLRILDMTRYDVILGMDWLTMYKALINCHHCRIIFCVSDGFEICFVGGKCTSFALFVVRYMLLVCVEEGINKFPSLSF